MVYNILSCFGALKIVFLGSDYVVIVSLLPDKVLGVVLNNSIRFSENTPFHRYL